MQARHWREELRAAYASPLELLDALKLTPDDVGLASNPGQFCFRVPRPFVSRMRRSDPHDPLLLQVLPRTEELVKAPGYDTDPVGDSDSHLAPGLLQKYGGRALLIATGGCAIHCRYCFRRHFPYQGATGTANLERALAMIADDDSLSEIILSGGDPLLLADDRIAAIVSRLSAVPHLRRLRIHTRLPVVIPSRMNAALTEVLVRSRLPTIVVLHINHPNEIDAELNAVLRHCSSQGLRFLNQSVLLRAINDDTQTLVELSESLFEASVLPYYVHLLDPVAGAAHFDVGEKTAREMAARLRARLPGYLVPRFVRETVGASAKRPIA